MRFLEGQGESDATLTGEDFTVSGVVRRFEQGFVMEGASTRSNPTDWEAHLIALDAGMFPENFKLSLRGHRADRAKAITSYTRSAYLAAFSAFGWSYILRTVLDPIRDALNHDAVAPPICAQEPDASDDRRDIMIVTDPSEFCSVRVGVGEYTVFLPDFDPSLSCGDLADALAAQMASGSGAAMTFHGSVVPWPAKPLYSADPPCD